MKNNVVSWFELPVENMERARKFYETVFQFQLLPFENPGLEMCVFPTSDGSGAAGSLVKHPDFYRPSVAGSLLYFTAQSGDLNNELGRVKAAGGKILIGKRHISESAGYMAAILDTEGNRIALHSKN